VLNKKAKNINLEKDKYKCSSFVCSYHLFIYVSDLFCFSSPVLIYPSTSDEANTTRKIP
jgi:hypothetical protein